MTGYWERVLTRSVENDQAELPKLEYQFLTWNRRENIDTDSNQILNKF